jgi:hypothetical protein
MITLRRRLTAMVVATFAVAVPVTAQSAGSYQKEPMFPDLVSVGARVTLAKSIRGVRQGSLLGHTSKWLSRSCECRRMTERGR